jgi:hypothetical protein
VWELVFRPSVGAMGAIPIPGASSDVAIRTDAASFGDNHFVCCDLLRHHLIHDGARKALEAKALLQPTPTLAEGHSAPSPTTQMAVFGILYVGMATVVHGVIVILAAQLRPWLVEGRGQQTVRRMLSVVIAFVAIGLAWTTQR